ncbi:cytosolic sulfotransferase 3-like isoform X2 [Acanthochromis polyacanthus]|uniref:cytosolic sulfotransferase 3-like isoform X2 n=1 Tax=Acanthochromis polyacanthus TaxID=80966 RepID=UPI0022342F90|nr:cytosolic sulfotransferase 3-like isoform X2 [Acanthochromis polyacanthus]
MERSPRPAVFDFHGVCMTEMVTNNWDNLQNFEARPDDILIAAYPKAGTEMTNQLTTTPRIIKTHLPVQFVPKSFWEQRCKIVYVERNSKDSAVSYFHFNHMNKSQPDPGDWSSFLEKYIEGQVMYGSWFDHVTNWWEKWQPYSHIHYMSYEDLSLDLGQALDRLCSFLGLSPSAEEKEKLAAAVKFDKMKENNMVNYSTVPIMDQKISPFMRKGKVGDWKNHFTVYQNEMFDQGHKQKMKNSTLKCIARINHFNMTKKLPLSSPQDL